MRSPMETRYRIAIIGCGVVGGATAQHLLQSEKLIRTRYGLSVELVAVVDLDLTRARNIGLPESILTTDLEAALSRDDVDLVVELIGGTETAFTVIQRCLAAGKHVVTANKALLAHRGADLFAAAHSAGRDLAFEASCGGGIPLIPGIATVSELMTGMERGYRHFKCVPAEAAGGARALKAISGVFPRTVFCPTGGVTPDNYRDYLSLDSVACVGGSWLVPGEALMKNDWQRITGLAAEAVAGARM